MWIICLNFLEVDDFDEEDEDVLELLVHYGLAVEHVVGVTFVALELVQLLDVLFVGLHDEDAFEILTALRLEYVGRWSSLPTELLLGCMLLNNTEYVILDVVCEVSMQLLLYLEIDRYILDVLCKLFFVLLHLLSKLLRLLPKRMLACFLVHHFIIPADDLLLLFESFVEPCVVLLEFADVFAQVLLPLFDFWDRWQCFDQAMCLIQIRKVNFVF